MAIKISGYSSSRSSQKCNNQSGKKSGGQHKSSGKKKSGGHKSGGKNRCQHKSSGKNDGSKSSGCCYQDKSSGKCDQHKSSGCHDNSAIPYNKEEKSSGKSNSKYAHSILSKLSLGQVIHRVTLDNGKDLDRVKWAGFQNGNATFSAVSYKTNYIVYVPLNKITSIAL
ncbi:hypothetical protein M3194_18015 [Paenibacillus glycanilyticus]|uniref:hypothetical protein n=1 Tax=Paenibacillus glycanilyticus TaxID=126569 RepID=UPI00203E8728|nr:hypothetical protein [Paenibacillus glycanilyticus]MCM3629244.1 hypothetical protein [Paenibacillus glycanilyticus]